MSLNTFISTSRKIMRGDAGVDGDAQRIAQLTWLLFLKVYDAKEADWEFHNPSYTSIIPEDLRWRSWAPDFKDGRSKTGEELLAFLNADLFPTLKTLPITPAMPLSQTVVRAVFEDSNQYMKDGILIRQLVNLIEDIDFEDYADRHAFGEIYETLLKELQSAGSSGEYYTPRAVTDFMIEMIDPKLGETVADFAAGTAGFLTSTLKHLNKHVESVEDREAYRSSVYGIEKKPMPYLLGVTNLLLHDVDQPQFIHGNSLERNVRDFKEDEKFDVVTMNPPYGGTEQESVKANFPRAYRSSETADLFIALITYRLKRGGRAGVVLPDGFLFGNDGAKLALKERLITDFNLHTIIRLPGSVFSPYTSIATNLLFFDNTGSTEETWYYRVDLPGGYKAFSKTRPMLTEHLAGAAEWWSSRREIVDAEGNPKAQRFTAEQLIAGGYNLDRCGFPQTATVVLSPEETIAGYKTKRAQIDAQIDAKIAEIEALLAVTE